MNVLRIDHVALAVKDLAVAEENFCKRLGATKLLEKTREDMGYVVSYLKWGESILTLVQPITPECFVNKHLDKFGEGLHHMGIEVDNLEKAEEYYVSQGGKVGPKEVIEGVRKEFVVPPKYNNGVLLQVIEYADAYKGNAPERYAKLAIDGNL
jgi:methylmalonyl-CoA/ethylmalonyl-CoA epimerase